MTSISHWGVSAPHTRASKATTAASGSGRHSFLSQTRSGLLLKATIRGLFNVSVRDDEPAFAAINTNAEIILEHETVFEVFLRRPPAVNSQRNSAKTKALFSGGTESRVGSSEKSRQVSQKLKCFDNVPAEEAIMGAVNNLSLIGESATVLYRDDDEPKSLSTRKIQRVIQDFFNSSYNVWDETPLQLLFLLFLTICGLEPDAAETIEHETPDDKPGWQEIGAWPP